jgi:hypothetical protein
MPRGAAAGGEGTLERQAPESLPVDPRTASEVLYGAPAANLPEALVPAAGEAPVLPGLEASPPGADPASPAVAGSEPSAALEPAPESTAPATAPVDAEAEGSEPARHGHTRKDEQALLEQQTEPLTSPETTAAPSTGDGGTLEADPVTEPAPEYANGNANGHDGKDLPPGQRKKLGG